MPYLNFSERGSDSGLTKIWEITFSRNAEVLGTVKWCSQWNKYLFYPVVEAGLQSESLLELGKFVKEKTIKHFQKLKTDRLRLIANRVETTQFEMRAAIEP